MTTLAPIYLIVVAFAILGLMLGWRLGELVEPFVKTVVRIGSAVVVSGAMAGVAWLGVVYLVSRI